MRRIGLRLRAAPRIVGRRPRAAPASRSMAAARCSIRVGSNANEHHCAARKEARSSCCSYQHCVCPVFSTALPLPLLFCWFLPWHSIRQNELAACKTLASKQNISEGCGAKLHQARAFLTSLLLTEKPAQFHANTASGRRRQPIFADPTARRQQGAPKGLPPGRKGSNARRTDRRRPQKQEVCVFGQPEPGLRGRRLRRDQFGCAAEG